MFQEYPKWVNGVIVDSAEAEATLLAGEEALAPEGDPLVTEAETLGIVVNKRWGDKRLAAEIAKAKG